MTSPLRIPHAPLSDTEWKSLLPHVLRATGGHRGRPCNDRAHFDAIFRLAATDGPWKDLPEEYGKHETISRYFRRLTHQGFWEHLLLALAAAPEDHPLRNILGLICRAARRAVRLRGLRIIVLARRLRLLRALPAPPWFLPNPDLSEYVRSRPIPKKIPESRRARAALDEYLGALRKLLVTAAGRRRIPGIIKRMWI